MNKKLFGTLLMGSLLMGGTFVSCQDYDDDIKDLQAQIDGLKPLSQTVSSLESALNGVKGEVQTNINNAIGSLPADVKAALKDAADALAAAKTAQEAADAAKALAEAAGQITGVDEEAAKAIEWVKANSEKLVNVAALEKAIKDAKADLQTAINSKADAATVKALTDTVNALKAKVEAMSDTNLKSLVFQPEFYLDGIEASEYTYLKYAALSTKGDAYVGDQKNNLDNKVKIYDDKYVWQYRHSGDILVPVTPGPINAITDKKTVDDRFVPAATKAPFYTIVGVEDSVKFALNPVDAKVKKEDLKLIAKDVNIQTRGAETSLEITRIKTDKGILTVYYKVADPLKTLITANNKEQTGYTLAKKDNTTTLELRAYKNDSLVNSDFAVVYENLIKPVAIALNAKATDEGWKAAPYCTEVAKSAELFKNPYEALKAVPTAPLAYNDPKGINLNEYINLHMVLVDEENTGKDSGHYAITLAEAKARYDLDVEYSLVPYETEADGNKTRPSNYVSLSNGVVVAGTVNADGSFNAAQGPSSVNKQPLVQVLVKRGKDVILDGYIKLTIAREIGVKQSPVFPLGTKAWNCAGLTFAQTWSQVSALLLEQTVGMSKLEFEANYVLVMDPAHTGVAQQYTYDTKKATTDKTAYKELDWKNTYTEVKMMVDPEGTTNTVLGMTLDTYAQQYVYEKANHTDIIYVKYVRKDDPSTEEGVYVPLQIALPERKAATLQKKNVNYWYAADGTPNITPDDAIRFNVNYPKDGGNTLTFVSDINNAWEGNKLVVFGADGKKLDPQPTTYYYFHPATNNVVVTDSFIKDAKGKAQQYELSVDYNSVVCHVWTKDQKPEVKPEAPQTAPVLAQLYKDISKQADPIAYTQKLELTEKLYTKQPSTMYANKALYAKIKGSTAAPVKIADLDPATGKVTYNNTDMAKLVLNAVSHNNAEAKVYVGVYYTDACDHAEPIAQNVFPAFFLRPLDYDNTKPAQVQDAKANADYVDVFSLFNFIDWRDVKFLNLDAKTDAEKYGNIWLLAYYGVKNVKIDLDKATTNMNGHTFDVTYKAVNNNILFSWVQDDKTTPQANPLTIDLSAYNKESAGTKATYDALVKLFGKIKYENNGANVSDFDVQVPVTFGYDWGELGTTITIHVKGTMANS